MLLSTRRQSHRFSDLLTRRAAIFTEMLLSLPRLIRGSTITRNPAANLDAPPPPPLQVDPKESESHSGAPFAGAYQNSLRGGVSQMPRSDWSKMKMTGDAISMEKKLMRSLDECEVDKGGGGRGVRGAERGGLLVSKEHVPRKNVKRQECECQLLVRCSALVS